MSTPGEFEDKQEAGRKKTAELLERLRGMAATGLSSRRGARVEPASATGGLSARGLPSEDYVPGKRVPPEQAEKKIKTLIDLVTGTGISPDSLAGVALGGLPGIDDALRARGQRDVAPLDRVMGRVPKTPSVPDTTAFLLRKIEGPSASPDLLRNFADYQDATVRVAVARHRNTPQDVVAMLAFDSSEGVRSAVVQNTTDGNVLKYLMLDSSETVRSMVQLNGRIDGPEREQLAGQVSEDLKGVGGIQEALSELRYSYGNKIATGLKTALRRQIDKKVREYTQETPERKEPEGEWDQRGMRRLKK